MRRLILALVLLLDLLLVPARPAGAIIDMYGFARPEPRVEVIGSTSTTMTSSTSATSTYYSQPIPPSYLSSNGRLRVTVFLTYASPNCSSAGAAIGTSVVLNYGTASITASPQVAIGDAANGCGSGVLTANMITFYLVPQSPVGSTPRQFLMMTSFASSIGSQPVGVPAYSFTASTITTVDPAQPQTLSVAFSGSNGSSTVTTNAISLMVEHIPGYGTPLGGTGWTLP